MSKKTIFSKKKLPIIFGAVLALLVAVFLIGAISNSLSGGTAIKVVSAQNVYQSAENPQFVFIYKNESNIFNKILTAISNLFSSESKKAIATVKIFDNNDKEIDNLNPQVKEDSSGKFSVELDHSKFQQELRPGQYEIEMEVTDGDKIYTQTQSFFWGVLAINANKSIYLVGEEAYLQLALLDKEGHTLCNSKLELQINPPVGGPKKLSTEDGTIKYSGECKGDNVTDIPDYFAYYNVSEPGRYEMKLINLDNGFEITDYFEVKESVDFVIERTGPTRIWPYANYAIRIKITANQDFEGEIIETVPMTFGINNATGADIQTISDNYIKLISWKTKIKKGEIRELSYSIDFPNVSPYFYLIGPLQLKSKCQSPNCSKLNPNPEGEQVPYGAGDQSSNYSEIIFEESRQWQIAADAETEIFITYDTAPNGYSCGANCFTVPTDWNSASNSVQVIGAGGTGGDAATNNGAAGGGGGGYSKGVNLDISGNITFGVGASGSQPSNTSTGGNGGNTWFNATSLADCETVGSASGGGYGCVGAEGGKGGQGSATGQAGGSGGLAANGVGNTARYSGGTGGAGSGNDGNGGGGGAAGPLIATDGGGHTGGAGSSSEGGGGGGAGGASAANGSASDSPNSGEGGNGGAGYSNAAGGDGGSAAVGAIGTTPAAGGGGGDDNYSGGNGAIGRQFSSTAGSGGGGGGAGDSGDYGGTGGKYGGGGGAGASCVTAGYCQGAGGVIYINYTPVPYTISGTCKQFDQSTNSTEAATIKAAINTSVETNTASCSSGSWTLNLTTPPVSEDVITVWVDNVGDANEAVAVTRYDGSGMAISGVNLYERHLVIGSNDNTIVSTSDLAVYDNSVSTDEDIFFDASATSLEVCKVSGCETSELYIVASNKYSVGSSSATFVEVHDIEIDGTFAMDDITNDTASISGSWNNDSVFYPGLSGIVYFVASDSAEVVSASADATNVFNMIKFGDSATTSYAGQWTLSGGMTLLDVDLSFDIEAGTLVNSGSKNITYSGITFTIGTNGAYTKGTGTFAFDSASGTTWIDNSSAKSDLGAVVINDNSVVLLGSSVKATSLEITSSDTLDVNGSNTLTLTGTGVSVFTNSGTFTCSTGTVVYEGTSATTVAALNGANKYYNLTMGLSTDTGTFSYTAAGEIEASGSVTLIAGSSGVHTFDMSTYNLSVGGGAASTGGIAVPTRTVFTQTSGTTKVYSSSGTATLGGAGTTKFYDFQIGNTSDGATYTFNLGGDVGASNSFTLAAGTHTLGLSSYEFGVWENWTMGAGASLSAQTGTLNLGNTNSTTLTCSTNCEPYNLTINKTSGTDSLDNVTLATNLIVRNTLTITDGQLIQGNNNVTVEAAAGGTAVSVAAGTDKEWTNIGTGDLVLGGTFANAGSVSFSTNDFGCQDGDGTTDDISISSTDGSLKTWTNTGTLNLYNITASYQADAAITCYSCTNSGSTSTWGFSNCPSVNLNQAHYGWRNDDNNEVSATWKRAEDNAHSGQKRSENVRLRFLIANTGVAASDNRNYVLQVASLGNYGVCESVPSASYSDVPTTTAGCGSSVACMTTSGNFINQATTTPQLTAIGTWVSGKIVEDPSNESDGIIINAAYYTEHEYNFQFTSNALNNTNYCFRVTKNGIPLAEYTKVPQITVESTGMESNLLNRLKGALRIKGSTRVR